MLDAMEMTLSHIQIAMFHPVITEIIEADENVDDAVQSLEYLRDEINKSIDILTEAL